MAPSQYLMRILSKPTKVSEDKWTQWYLDEHLPDVIKTGVADRGAFFKAYNDYPLPHRTTSKADVDARSKLSGTSIKHFGEWADDFVDCAVYQTKHEDYTKTEEIKTVPQTSEVFGGEKFLTLAQWDIRIYKLIQNYDPDNLGEVQPHYTLHVQVEPADDTAYNKFYAEEHLDMLHKVPGYLRSQRYELVNQVAGEVKPTPRFLAIHEFSSLDGLDGPEIHEADATPAVAEIFGNAKAVNIRGFKCLKSKGYTDS